VDQRGPFAVIEKRAGLKALKTSTATDEELNVVESR